MFGFAKEVKDLENLLYSKLVASKDGILTLDEIFDVYDSDPIYGLKKVCGPATINIRQREDVEELRDEKGRPYLKLSR